MELIKQIKEAETKASETVTQAKADAVKLAEQTDTKQAEMLEQAQQERNSAITQAVAEAEVGPHRRPVRRMRQRHLRPYESEPLRHVGRRFRQRLELRGRHLQPR